MATPGAIQSQDISVDDPEVEASKENIRPGREPLKSYKNTLAVSDYHIVARFSGASLCYFFLNLLL
ncbi:hypothetical protein DPMN_161011 [Dreissena polymorpha]|uniref:Uncharacterized protein n=1 Tax=Dreissena polymorpha TaxID=45954 RepID=A0A9D4ENX7_DREPO|nr:hypothetical protein DPMN_161011 [Dreissena polymorpha]